MSLALNRREMLDTRVLIIGKGFGLDILLICHIESRIEV